MGKAIKWLGIVLGILIGAVLIAYTALYIITENRLNEVYNIPASDLSIPSDETAITRGRHIATTFGFCTECHGPDLSGTVMEDDPIVGRLVAPNLTRGSGGVGSRNTDEDWIRAIRHGVDRESKPLLVMPSDFFNRISDRDLAALIAYIKSLPPVDHEIPLTQLGPMGRLFLLQDPALLPAQSIDHSLPPPDPEPGINLEYGEYLTTVCTLCHGENLAGGEEFGAGLNLTPAGNLRNWSEDDFIRAMRTGVTPEGESLDPLLMPWESIGRLTDAELKAIWLYLQSVPPVEDVQPAPEARSGE